MKEIYKEKYGNITFLQMDVRNLSAYKDGAFDVVIDKALLDDMATSAGRQQNIQAMLSEIHRVLSPTGSYICISKAPTARRKPLLKNVKKYNWTIDKRMIPK